MTPPGIDPETVRLVAQCSNHYASPGPSYHCRYMKSHILTKACDSVSLSCLFIYQDSILNEIMCSTLLLSYYSYSLDVTQLSSWHAAIKHSKKKKWICCKNQWTALCQGYCVVVNILCTSQVIESRTNYISGLLVVSVGAGGRNSRVRGSRSSVTPACCGPNTRWLSEKRGFVREAWTGTRLPQSHFTNRICGNTKSECWCPF